MDLIYLLFGIQGRISRASFWLAVLIWFVFIVAAIVLGMVLTSSLSVLLGVAAVSYIPIIASAVAVGIKRLHDREKSGWWLLLFYGVPNVLSFAGAALGAGDEAESETIGVVILQYISLAVSLWALVELGFLRGTIGGNAHGPDPLAPKPAKH